MRKMCSTQKIGLFLVALVFAGWIGLLVLYPAEGLPLPVFGMYLNFARIAEEHLTGGGQ